MSVKKRLPCPYETVEQAQFVTWFELQFNPVRIHSVPNGGTRNLREAKKLKREGVRGGVPDLHVPEWDLWIEMKRIRGSSTRKNQLDWHAYLRSIGDTVIVPNGFSEAREMTLKFLREREVER